MLLEQNGAMFTMRESAIKTLTNRTLIILLAAILGLALTFNVSRKVQDNQFRERALTLAQTVAVMPPIAQLVKEGDPLGLLQPLANKIAKETGAAYVVIADINGIRITHPNPAQIGKRIDGQLLALQGKSYTTLNEGSLGRSANGKTPIYDSEHKIVGLVSAGFLTSSFIGQTSYLRESFILYGLGVILLGIFLAEFLYRRFREKRLDIELRVTKIAYQEREAMLHAIKEGVITLDPQGRVTMLNDEAKRLLSLSESAVGELIETVLPAGRLLDLIEGEGRQAEDEIVLNDNFSLRVHFRPVRHLGRDIGAVITMRDRTEHIGLLRELDSVKNLTNALRAQQHEYANRIHTLGGLLDLGDYEEAIAFLGEISEVDADLAERLNDTTSNPTLTALLLAKVVIAREKGVKLTVDARTSLNDLSLDSNAQVTVVGNLLDNAIEAVTGHAMPLVSIVFSQINPGKKIIRVQDSGPGLPEPNPEVVLQDGFSTKALSVGRHRGLGLAIMVRLIRQAGGTITCFNNGGAVFEVEIPIRV